MSNPYQPPPGVPQYHPPGSGEGDATGGVIPYKNPYALTAYYLGILSLLCCITGLPWGLIPVVLGIIGLRKRAQNPVIKGSVHAWIGIVLGTISALASIPVAIGFVGMMLENARR
jgi:hypothetical protein